MMNLLIRKATLADCAGFQHLHREDNDPWHSEKECTAWVCKRLERGFYIQATELDGKIVGHGEWIVNNGPEGKFLYLGMLQVDADYQKRGIGYKMIEDGVRYAKELGCSRVVTIPDMETGSIEFYRKCGFMEGRKIKNIYLPTRDTGYSQIYTISENIPFSVIKSHLFIFGLGQASSRHIWEVYNQKPATDYRFTTALLSTEVCIQLGWFEEDESAYALLWCQTPVSKYVGDILSLGYRKGFRFVEFSFFEAYEYMFEPYGSDIQTRDIEIFKTI